MIIGAVIGGIVGLVIGVTTGEVSRVVAPEPIRASFVSWVIITTLAGMIPGAALGWLVTVLFRLI